MSAWEWTEDPTAPCSYCVQWRCTVQGEHDDLNCGWEHAWEPYWPDGSVAMLVRRGACDRCVEAIAAYVDGSDGL